MKKYLSRFVLVFVFALVFCMSATTTATAESLPNFADDFESYEVTGQPVETNEEIKKNWTNNVLKGGEALAMDSHIYDVAKIKYENGTSGNKVLALNNTGAANTFFYMGPAGDYRVKNFTVEFRLKFLADNVPERSWIGISFRKKAPVHYTGTNNLMFVVQRWIDTNMISGHSYAIFDGGSANDLNSMTDLYGDKLSVSATPYAVPNGKAGEDLPWVNYKLVVNGSNYSIYVDDFMVSECTFNVNKYDYFGYLSLNCCVANVLVDDFRLTVQDTELPPVISPLEAPVVTFNEAEEEITWDYVEGATTYRVSINGANSVAFNNKYSLKSLRPGTYEITVTAISDDSFLALDSAPSAVLNYTVEEIEPEPVEKKGCKGAMGIELSAIVAIAAFGISEYKRRRS